MTVPPLAHDPASTPVAVVLGGPSAEHDVSIVSGTAIAEALTDSGYPVELWLIDLAGGWWRLPDGHRRDGRPQSAYDDPATLGADGPVAPAAALGPARRADAPPVVFIALHGPFGEDGTVQALCEAAGLAYTGLGRDGVGDRHGQGRVQAPHRRPGAARDGRARGPGGPLGTRPRRRARRARGVRRGRPATRA